MSRSSPPESPTATTWLTSPAEMTHGPGRPSPEPDEQADDTPPKAGACGRVAAQEPPARPPQPARARASCADASCRYIRPPMHATGWRGPPDPPMGLCTRRAAPWATPQRRALPGYPVPPATDDRPARADDGRRVLELSARPRTARPRSAPPGAVRRRVHDAPRAVVHDGSGSARQAGPPGGAPRRGPCFSSTADLRWWSHKCRGHRPVPRTSPWSVGFGLAAAEAQLLETAL